MRPGKLGDPSPADGLHNEVLAAQELTAPAEATTAGVGAPMSERTRGLVEVPQGSSPQRRPVRGLIGERLRSARRSVDLGLEAIAEQTRIRAAFLESLEQERFDFLAPVYVRGFLRAYARAVGLDSDPLVEELDAHLNRTDPAG